MKVLVATAASQGTRAWDLWGGCAEGEPVRPVEERCGRRRGSGCSCETAFVGVRSHALTTTAVVRDLPELTPARYAAALRRSLTDAESRWIVAARYAEELARVAGGLAGRGVVERWDQWVTPRFGRDGLPNEDVISIADDVDRLAQLDEEAEIGDRLALVEREASGEFDDA